MRFASTIHLVPHFFLLQKVKPIFNDDISTVRHFLDVHQVAAQLWSAYVVQRSYLPSKNYFVRQGN